MDSTAGNLGSRKAELTPCRHGGLPALLFLVNIMAALLILGACQSYEFKGTEYPDPQPAPDIFLDNVKGGTFQLSEERGKFFLLYFGYTSCPDICPSTLATARLVFDDLGDEASQAALLFVTVDPERDTPEVMSNYVSAFHPNIIGLTGSIEALRAIFDGYGIVAEREELPESAVGYVMSHTTRMFLVDAQGRLRMSFAYGTPAEDVSQDLQRLLKE